MIIMGLRLEVYDPATDQWVKLSLYLTPGDRPGSMSHNPQEGVRELYYFDCAEDDSHSTIYRSPLGIDIVEGQTRMVINERSGWETVTELKDRDKPYVMTFKIDQDSQGRLVRFTHIAGGH